jgi:imidazole glycerol-phosphate synthase subunit HisF
MYYGADVISFENAKALRNNMTGAEQLLWSRLSKNQLGIRFKSQHPISNYIIDFYCHAAKLVIELDGDIHFDNDAQQKDADRQTELENLELIVIRFTNEEIFKNTNEIIGEIKIRINGRLSQSPLQGI